MRHFIIVKWKNPSEMVSEYGAIENLFKEVLTIPGIHSVLIHPSCSSRSNRYDLMIEIVMDEEALPAYDVSEPHHRWKELYGGAIEHKVIFDCE